jgi:hypothetical protein
VHSAVLPTTPGNHEKEMANPPAKSTVSASIKDNRLIITLAGNISVKEAERIYTDIRFAVADLQPGFAAITDLSHSRIGHLSAIGTFRKIMTFLKEKEVGLVIRIIGKGRIIYLQMLQLATPDSNYKPIYVGSMEEAKAHLEKLSGKSPGNAG